LLLGAALLDVACFSAFGAALVVSSPAPVLFCCAHNGKANSALITSAAHQLRISILLSFIQQIPFDSRARLLTARFPWRAALDALQHFTSHLFLQRMGLSPHPSPSARRKLKKQNDTAH